MALAKEQGQPSESCSIIIMTDVTEFYELLDREKHRNVPGIAGQVCTLENTSTPQTNVQDGWKHRVISSSEGSFLIDPAMVAQRRVCSPKSGKTDKHTKPEKWMDFSVLCDSYRSEYDGPLQGNGLFGEVNCTSCLFSTVWWKKATMLVLTCLDEKGYNTLLMGSQGRTTTKKFQQVICFFKLTSTLR